MNRTTKSGLAIAVTLGIGVPVWWFGVAVEDEPPLTPPRDLGPVPVHVRPVVAETLPLEVEAYGNLLARERVVLSAELTARIDAVHPAWRPGADFAAGDTLVDLDAGSYHLASETARAAVAEAEVGLEAARVELERARQALANAEQQRTVTTREHERMIALLEEGAASESLVDRALRARLSAELAADAAASAVAAAQSAQAGAQARSGSARARLAEAADREAKAVLVAPFPGRFVGRPPAVGTLAVAGAPLGEIVDVRELVLSARVPERDLLRLRPGMQARLRFPSSPELADAGHAVGTVRAVGAVSDVTTRRGTVEIDVRQAALAWPANGGTDGHDVQLPVGLFAAATILVEERAGALWIDRRHLVWEGAGATCYVLQETPDGAVARARQLVLREEHGEGFLVDQGLVPGDLLITGPLDRVADGTPCVRDEPEDGGGR